MFERHSALAAVLKPGARPNARGELVCRIGERRGWTLLQVTAQQGSEAKVAAAVAALAGQQSLRAGPDQYLLVGQSLPSLALNDSEAALVDLSHARTRLFLEGEPATEILARGAALDFHDSAFPLGHFAQTGIHHTPVAIWRTAPQCYELFALRTFGRDLWEWLEDACLPFGYEVV